MSPCAEGISAHFLITKGISAIPILGLPLLASLGLSINCGNRELVHRDTGKVVRCSAAFCPSKRLGKNWEDQ